ncbi:SEC-C metal-binding domain-containing protein [Syntrophomonas palmitatica]|uniref:SEC-C metal-binding domain-containing protein n=1 Tax=Syntrophomonas palmitatica TaxID=402877 RepID=UPI0006D19387|nr:SEC-C domain-containing protein [Syntrophomonas palmitatica]
MKKYPRNALCPCGSGKKYKHCCIDKEFEWVERNGEICKRIPLPNNVTNILKKQYQKHIDTFGREPGPDDLVFFNVPSGIDLEKETVKIMEEAGIPGELIYAYKKTGRLVSEENKKYLTDAELKEWKDAIAEYYSIYH